MCREKPEHSSGGRWRLRHTDIRSADYLWCELAMSAIGEKLGQLVDSHNTVIGVGVSPRPSGVVIDIWTASVDFDADQTNQFGQRLNDLILPQPLTFKLIFYESKLNLSYSLIVNLCFSSFIITIFFSISILKKALQMYAGNFQSKIGAKSRHPCSYPPSYNCKKNNIRCPICD